MKTLRAPVLFIAWAAAALLHASTLPAPAQSMRWGVNAAVGSATALVEVRENYKSAVEKIFKETGMQLETRPLYSSLVTTSLKNRTYPLLLVHTNDAAPFLVDKSYILLALSDDVEGNRISFVGKKDLGVKSLGDLAGQCVVSTGTFGTAITQIILTQAGVREKLKRFHYVRDGDAVQYFLNNNFCDIGVTRSASLVRKLEKDGGKLVYRSDPYPVYAVVASADLSPALVEKLKKSLFAFKPDPESDFTRATKIRGFVEPDGNTEKLIGMFR